MNMKRAALWVAPVAAMGLALAVSRAPEAEASSVPPLGEIDTDGQPGFDEVRAHVTANPSGQWQADSIEGGIAILNQSAYGGKPKKLYIDGGTYTDEYITLLDHLTVYTCGAMTISGEVGAAEVMQVVGGGSTSPVFHGSSTFDVKVRPHGYGTGTVANQRAIVGKFSGAATIGGVIFEGFDVSAAGTATADGGAIYQLGGSLEFCTFTDCDVDGNGGAAAEVGGIESCKFVDCDAGLDGGAVFDAVSITDNPASGDCADNCTAGGNGGAFANISDFIGADNIADRVTIVDCVADAGGGIADSDADLQHVWLLGNEATGEGGGGVYNISGQIEQCMFAENEATDESGGTVGRGGGARDTQKIVYSIFVENFACGQGGAIHKSKGVKNCTIIRNTSLDTCGGINNDKGTIRNSIVRDNVGDGGTNSSQIRNASASVRFCCLPDGWSAGGGQNVKADPEFTETAFTASPELWLLTLKDTSPCIGEGRHARLHQRLQRDEQPTAGRVRPGHRRGGEHARRPSVECSIIKGLRTMSGAPVSIPRSAG